MNTIHKEVAFEGYISFHHLGFKMFKMFKALIILIILIRIQGVQGLSHLDYLNFVDRHFLSNYLVKSNAWRIVLINTRLVTLSFLFKSFRLEIIHLLLLCRSSWSLNNVAISLLIVVISTSFSQCALVEFASLLAYLAK